MSQIITSSLEAALEYLRRRWAVIPIPRGEKKPNISKWKRLRLTDDQLPKRFPNRQNVGVILGKESGGLIDIDLDSAEALACADHFLPPTPAIFGRASKPHSHRLYNVPDEVKYLKFTDPCLLTNDSRSTIVELRQDGHQTLFPPSEADGETREWEKFEAPAQVNGPMLSEAVAHLSAAALLVRYWPTHGRHDVRMALGGVLARGGWSEDATTQFVQKIIEITQPGDTEAYGKVAGDTRAAFAKLRRREPVMGLNRLEELLGEKIVQRLRKWLGLDDGHDNNRDDKSGTSGRNNSLATALTALALRTRHFFTPARCVTRPWKRMDIAKPTR